jgi:ubiquinone/menaquinone biosynthesis C-methylase UbiE
MAETASFRRHLTARTHAEAYDLWARHFADPALMANRDARTTFVKLSRLAARLPLAPTASVLDVGPGDGTLFRILAHRVARCCGADPSAVAVSRLKQLHADLANVEFVIGTATALPFPAHTFDIVVVNSVLQSLSSTGEILDAMRELVRVCKPGGIVFVGELPFQPELSKGVLPHLARKLHESGAANLLRLLWNVYAKPVLRGEPVLSYPATNLFVPAEDFVAFCKSLGLAAEVTRHQELRRPSLTRNDYLLRVA